jgi:hypothetical protein
VRDIAERQARRIAALAPDGLVLYDLQDEAGRTEAARPFPFLPTLEPLDYSRDYLRRSTCRASYTSAWATRRRPNSSRGSTHSRPARAATPACLWERPRARGPKGRARSACRPRTTSCARAAHRPAWAASRSPSATLRKLDEGERLFGKHAAGCRFFISQTVFDASATKSLLSDYALRFAREHLAPVPFILSFSPCGSLKTMEFMKWLGISFPRWLENDLRTAPDILRKSVDLALQIFADVRAFAKDKGIPLGVNVESVSIRKEEIEASGELFEALSARTVAARALREIPLAARSGAGWAREVLGVHSRYSCPG